MEQMYKKADAVLSEISGSLNENEILYLLQTKDISSRYINMIKEYTDFSYETISSWLNITPRTLRSYLRTNSTMNDNMKEHLLLLLSLFKHGYNVFGSPDDFGKWLKTSNFFIDGKAPAGYLNTITGIRYIDNRLTAMEYGDNV